MKLRKKDSSKPKLSGEGKSDIFSIHDSKPLPTTGKSHTLASRFNPVISILIGSLILLTIAGFIYLGNSNTDDNIVQNTDEISDDQASFSPPISEQLAAKKQEIANSGDQIPAIGANLLIETAYIAYLQKDPIAVTYASEALSIINEQGLNPELYGQITVDMQQIIDGTYTLPQ